MVAAIAFLSHVQVVSINMPVDTEPHKKPAQCSQKIKCKLCAAVFGSMKALSAHMRVHKNTHPVVKLPPAPILMRPVVVQRPKPVQYLVEEDAEPSVCNVCNTVFKSNKSLKYAFMEI